MTNAIVLGAQGMLGHVLYLRLREEIDKVKAYARSTNTSLLPEIEYFDWETDHTLSFLQNEEPRFLFNCTGVLVKSSEDHRADAVLVNSYGPHKLAEVFKDKKTVVVNFSTDCVFSGANGPYGLNHAHDGKSFYARTKSVGEVRNDKDITIRTSIVGPELKANGSGLFHWWSQQEGPVRGYKRAIWSGWSTVELSSALAKWVRGVLQGTESAEGGVYQIATSPISKYGLLIEWNRQFDRPRCDVRPDNDYVVDKSLVPSAYCPIPLRHLSHGKMAFDIRRWIKNHSDLYPHYAHLIGKQDAHH